MEWSSRDYPLLECRRCGLIYAANWEEQVGNRRRFHEDNISYWEARTHLELGPAEEMNRQRADELLEKLGVMAPEKTLLDVGCGAGELVGAASDLGWSALGTDLAPPAVEIARKKKRNCQVIDLFSNELDGLRFGVIVMSEFIEHVPQPSEFFRRARELLYPSGLLYVSTPNVDSFGRRILGADWSPVGEGHVALFATRTLVAVGLAANFDVVETGTRAPSVAALAHLLRKARTTSHQVRDVDAQYQQVQNVRMRIHRSPSLTRAKQWVDRVVARTELGDTLIALFRKPKVG